MHNPGQIPPFLEREPFHINGTLEDFKNSLNLYLYLDQNKMILDPDENETESSQKIVRMPKEHLLAYLQQLKSSFEVLWVENWSLIEQNEELKKQIQDFSGSVNEENCETQPEVKIEEQEESPESPCNCLVCKLFEAGEIIIEGENEDNIETDKRLVVRLSTFMKKKQQQSMMEEVGQNFEKVEEKQKELLRNLEQLEAAKLFTEKKLIEVKVKNQGLLKSLEKLKTEKLIIDEKLAQEEDRYRFAVKELVKAEQKNKELKIGQLAMKKLQKENDEMKAHQLIKDGKLAESENKNQALLKDFEDLKAASLSDKEVLKKNQKDYDEKVFEMQQKNQQLLKRLVQAEEKIQQLQTDYNELEAIGEKKLIQVKGQNQALLKDLEALKSANFNEKEKMKQDKKDHDEKVFEMQERNKTLLNRLVQAEEKNRQLQKNYKKLKAINLIIKNTSANIQYRFNRYVKSQQRSDSVREKDHKDMRKSRKNNHAMKNRNQSQQPHKNYKANQKESNRARNNNQKNFQVEEKNQKISQELKIPNQNVARVENQRNSKNTFRENEYSTSLGRNFNQETLELKNLNKKISQQLEQKSQNPTAFQSKFEPQQIDAQSNRNQVPRQRNQEKNNSRSASTTLNAKRNFESVRDGFSKDNVKIEHDQNGQWNSFNPEPLIIKKLKNN